MDIGLLVNSGKSDVFPRVREILSWLEERSVTIHVERGAPYLREHDSVRTHDRVADLCEQAEVVIVFGGDGTILDAARHTGGTGTPLLGVNSGGLGFLTETTLEEVEESLERVVDGRFQLDERMMLSGHRPENPGTTLHALNDLVLSRSKLGRVVRIRTYVGEDFVTEYVCDGIIVSTPTGSTAYNLSAQGPIIHPEMNAVVVNPICPHTLTNRPLILPEHAELRFVVLTDDECILTADGQQRITGLHRSDEVVIRRSDRTVSLIHPKDRTFYEILRSKLQWGGAT